MAGQRGGSVCKGKGVEGGQGEYRSEHVVGIKDNSVQQSQFRFIYQVQEVRTVLRYVVMIKWNYSISRKEAKNSRHRLLGNSVGKSIKQKSCHSINRKTLGTKLRADHNKQNGQLTITISHSSNPLVSRAYVKLDLQLH